MYSNSMVTIRDETTEVMETTMVASNNIALEELNRRLAVVRDRVRGVGFGLNHGFYLFGRPGTSKTYTVINTLKECKISHHHYLGHLTPMGLFDLMADMPDRVLVLDDVSQILSDRKAVQLMLAALGNQPGEGGARMVKYRRQGHNQEVSFTGGIICISNLELNNSPLLQALKSRMHYLKYDPSDEQIAALMHQVGSKGWSQEAMTVNAKECQHVTDYLIAESQRLAIRLDMRLLVDKAFPDYIQHRQGQTEAHWKDLVTSTLEEQLVELKHPARPHSRQEQKLGEQDIVRGILSTHTTPDKRVAAWQEQTGKSERAFYRRLQELG